MQQYTRSSIVSISEVVPYILDRNVDKTYLNGKQVGVSSLRLRTFANKGTECSACHLQATHFAIEACLGQDSYHLNLYGSIDGDEVLFTHDHTLARSLGGKDNIDNTTTMCYTCNQEKSIGERNLKDAMRKAEKESKND